MKIKTLLVFLILFCGLIIIYKKVPQEVIEKSSYSDKAVSVMNELNIYDEINTKNYSLLVEKLLEKNDFNVNYLNEYFKITYVEKNDFLNIINTLLNNGYNA